MTFLDRIKETSTSTGTGAFTLGGAVLGYKVFSNGTYKYCIVNETESEWEVGEGTVTSGVLTRTTIEASSNGGAAVVFTAGTKYIFNTVSAAYVNSLVPYTGATASVNLGAYGLTSDYYQLSTTPTAGGAVGRMLWNDTDGTMDIGLKGGNVTLQVGQEQVVRVVNKVGSTLTEAAYQAVYISGAQGQRPKVALAQANVDATSASTIGLVTETIADNQEGFITTSGIVRGINTTGSLQGETWADGDIVYLSPTTAGRITNVKPTAPNHTVVIGYVIYAHATQGKIFVKVDNGYEIGELHDVYAPSPATGNGLFWNATNSRYELNTINGVLGYTAANDSLVVHLAGAENITGVKTFQNALQTTVGNNLLNTGGGNTVIGYTSDPASSGTYKLDVNGSVNINTGILNKKLYTNTISGGESFKIGTGYELYGTLHSAGGFSTFITTTGFSSGWNIIIGNNTAQSLIINNTNVKSTYDLQALAGMSNVTGNGSMSTYFASPYEGFKPNTTNGWGFAIFNSANSPMMAVKNTGQMQLNGYTSTSVFTGTVAGLLGFDSSGNVITTSASGGGITGSGTAGQVTYWSGTSAVTGSSNLVWDNTNGRLGIGTNAPAYDFEVIKTATSNRTWIKNLSSSGYTAITISNDTNQVGNFIVFGSNYSNGSISNKIFLESQGTNGLSINLYNNSTSANFSIFSTLSITEKFRLFGNTGNLMLQNGGTFSDGGQRLQVIGSMRVGTTTASAMYWDDTNNRLVIGNTSGTARLDVGASTTGNASLRIRSGTAPTSPNDGEIWYDGTNIYIRVGTTTKTFTIL